MVPYGLQPLIGWLWLVGVVSAVPASLTRPPRGWSTRGVFDYASDCSNGMDTCLSDVLMSNMADVLARPEFSRAGYDWLLLGDCWSDDFRGPQGQLVANGTRFAGGIKAVADYAHGKGLRLALYMSLSSGYGSQYQVPGMQGNIMRDVKAVTSWGVDMIYVDTRRATSLPQVNSDLRELRQVIETSGSDLKVACNWPTSFAQHGQQINYDDVKEVCDVYQSTATLVTSSDWNDVMQVTNYYANDTNHVTHAPGSRHKWNDMGMLLVGQGSLGLTQWQAQMAVWTMYDSAMFVSCDLPSMPDDVKGAMLLAEVLGFNADAWDQRPAHTVQRHGHLHVSRRRDRHGDLVLLLLNASPRAPALLTTTLPQLGLDIYPAYRLRDVIKGVDRGQVYVTEDLNVPVAPASVVVLRILSQH